MHCISSGDGSAANSVCRCHSRDIRRTAQKRVGANSRRTSIRFQIAPIARESPASCAPCSSRNCLIAESKPLKCCPAYRVIRSSA